MADRRTTTTKRPGVASIHGKDYLMVMPRLFAAFRDSDGVPAPHRGVGSIKSDVREVAGRIVVIVTLEFDDGFVSSGMSEAKLTGAQPGSAEATNPVECAQTSALGRALAFAGWPGSEDGFAGAEEIQTAMATSAAARSTATAPMAPTAPTTPTAAAKQAKLSAAEAYRRLAVLAAEHRVAYLEPPPNAGDPWYMRHGPLLKAALITAGVVS